MKNLEIAKIFYEIADILELQNVNWKPRAYRKAAKSIESLSKDIEEIYKEQGIKGLENIPGVGERLAKKIIEFIETGKVKTHEKLKKSIPRHLVDLMEVPGLGPKRAEFLYKKLHIKTIKQLEQAAKQHKIKNLPTFKEKSEENILQGIQIFKKGQERTMLGLALPVVEEIESRLRKLKQVDKAVAAGSVRRRKETIRDIDILVSSNNPTPVTDFFTKMPEVQRILAKGPTKSSILLKNGLQVDLRIIPPDRFGSALQYLTGSKDHSIKLRSIAIKKNLKLSEYGLFDRKTNNLVAAKTEEEIYNKIGLSYIEPELRENQGEIEAALQGKLPNLVKLSDIKGDLHAHSNYTDGSNKIEDIATAARHLGYSYICITDHAKAIGVAHGLTEQQLKKQIKEIDLLNKNLKNFRILKGTELNIKQDGTLDYSNNLLKELDIVVASVHHAFKLDKKKMTARIIKAMENEYVTIIGHPTGRMMGKRNPYELDFNKIFETAKSTNTALEINSMPDRLDLNDINIRSAVENKVKLAINTDSHNISHLKLMELGVMQARRGWATKKDIINTLPLKELLKK